MARAIARPAFRHPYGALARSPRLGPRAPRRAPAAQTRQSGANIARQRSAMFDYLGVIDRLFLRSCLVLATMVYFCLSRIVFLGRPLSLALRASPLRLLVPLFFP